MTTGDRAPSDVVSPGDDGNSFGRTPLMSIPEIRNMSGALIENGYGDLVDKTEAYLEIDTTAIKLAALTQYGMTDQGERPVPPEDLNLFDLGSLHPDKFFIRNAPNTLALEEFSDDIHDKMQNELSNWWSGNAHKSFSSYIDELERITKREGERLRTIGDALHYVAEAIETAQEDAETTFWGAAGMAVTTGSLTTAALTGSGVLLALAGGLTTAASQADETARRARELAESQTNAGLDIQHPEYMESRPRELLDDKPYPKNPEDWKINENG